MKRKPGRRDFIMRVSTVPGILAGYRRGVAAHQRQEASAMIDEIFAAGDALDTLLYSLARYENVSPSLTFRAGSREEARAWQRKLRGRVVELLGGFPMERQPLRAKILRTEQMDGYRRERILFWSRPGLQVFGYLLLPADFRTAGPHGIELSRSGQLGVGRRGAERQAERRVPVVVAVQRRRDAGLDLTRVLEPDPADADGFGHRRDEASRKGSAERSSCQPAAGAALMLGETMAGWRTWDVIRALDYLETRPEIDPKRIGCMGISGGGTVTLYAAAVEQRIKVAFLSGSFCSFKASIYSLSHCIDNYVPGILKAAEAYDIAGLIAPRHLFAENGTEDPIFPVAGTRLAFERTRKIYRVFGKEENLGLETFSGKHEFSGKQGFAFLKANL